MVDVDKSAGMWGKSGVGRAVGEVGEVREVGEVGEIGEVGYLNGHLAVVSPTA